MEITKLENAKKVPFNLDAFIMHSDHKVELVHLTLKSNEKMELHKNPFDVIFYIVDGEGELQVEEKKYTLNKFDTLRIDKTKNRAWVNNSGKDFTVLVIKLLGEN